MRSATSALMSCSPVRPRASATSSRAANNAPTRSARRARRFGLKRTNYDFRNTTFILLPFVDDRHGATAICGACELKRDVFVGENESHFPSIQRRSDGERCYFMLLVDIGERACRRVDNSVTPTRDRTNVSQLLSHRAFTHKSQVAPVTVVVGSNERIMELSHAHK
jgi:hypothetical protein